MDRILGIAAPAPQPRTTHAPLPRDVRSLPWIVRKLMAWQRRAEERHRLDRMSDADLADVGLTRAALDLPTRRADVQIF